MPSTFQRLAVDLDGDGRRDVVDSVPDAVGSTANFLKKAGWVTGLPWGYEVRLPENFSSGLAGRKNKRPVVELGRHGRDPGRRAAAVGRLRGGAIMLPAGITARPSW